MTIKFTENDVGTVAYNIVKLDENGKLPAVDGSLLTDVSGAATNGKVFDYITQDDAVFTAVVDKFYWLRLADVPNTATNTNSETTQNYTITLPSTGVYTGSKVCFESWPRNAQSKTNVSTTSGAGPVYWYQNCGIFTLTVPSHVGSGFSSIKANIFGEEFLEGETWTAKPYAFRSVTLYAYIEESDNSLTWFSVRGDATKLGDLYRFDINNTRPYVAGRSYYLAADVSTSVFSNFPVWQHIQVTGNTTLAVGTGANQIDVRHKRILITVNAATTPTITLPLASTSLLTGLVLVFKVLPNFKNLTLADATGRTRTGGFILQRNSSDIFSNQPGVLTQSTYTSFTKQPNNFTSATGFWTNSVVVLSASAAGWYVFQCNTANSYTN